MGEPEQRHKEIQNSKQHLKHGSLLTNSSTPMIQDRDEPLVFGTVIDVEM